MLEVKATRQDEIAETLAVDDTAAELSFVTWGLERR